MEHCSYLAFLVDTWEESYTFTADVNLQSSNADGSPRRAGRPRHVRSQYTENHPKCQMHHRVFRMKKHNTLPQISGPWFPWQDDPLVYNFYCACMLALLKPWRIAGDLKNDDESWAEALEKFIASSPVIMRRILAGIQYYYDSKAATESSAPDDDAGNMHTQSPK